jgi:hypothetical protein
MDGLITPIKRQRFSKWIRNKICLSEACLSYKDTERLKVEAKDKIPY